MCVECVERNALMNKVDMGNGVYIDEDVMDGLNRAAAAYYDYHDNVARSMIDDPDQLEFFDRWLQKKEYSPDPLDVSKRQVYDAIVYLTTVGCG